jgi:hypothetical protein
MQRDPDDEDAQVIVCAGPPCCDLDGDEAVAQQVRGCIWCSYITVHPDGTQTCLKMSGNA